MDESQQTRRLCAVLLADVTGYSRLMSEDEPRAMAALARIRDIFTAVIPRHGGTLDVFVGDCFVALFASAVGAVQAAIAIQTALGSTGGPASDPVRIRIGVHLGEVVRAGTEVYGDSINVAARIQTIARPGGIMISDDVYRAVRNKVSVPLRDAGQRELKNIPGKVHVYEVDLGDLLGSAPTVQAERTRPVRPLLLGAGGLLVLAALGAVGYRLVAPPAAPRAAAPRERPVVSAERPLVVGVMEITTRGDAPGWMREVTRDGLNTILSKVAGLRVYSRQKIDFLREKRGLSELEAAEELGIAKMISGSVGVDGARVVLEAQVVDIATGLLDTSDRIDGQPAELIELQNRIAANMLAALNVTLSAEERTLIFARRTNETLDSYKLLTDTFGGDAARVPPAPAAGGTSWLAWPATAHAQSGDDEASIRAVLEAFRAALEAKDLERVSAVQIAMDDTQRAAFARYFEHVGRLAVRFDDIDILVEGDEALVTFTRRDDFRDTRSEKDLQLEVRLSSVLVRSDGAWRIRELKKS